MEWIHWIIHQMSDLMGNIQEITGKIKLGFSAHLTKKYTGNH